jgi:hypothetical protein
VTFTKVLTIHLSSFPPSWNSFNSSHFSIFIYEYLIFPLFSPFSVTLSFFNSQWGNYLYSSNNLCFLSFLHLLTCAYIVWATSLTPPTSRYHLFCPLVLWFCWRENLRDNKKGIAFFQVELKTAIQKDSWRCTHAYVYCNPHCFTSTRPLHYFLVPFPQCPLPV